MSIAVNTPSAQVEAMAQHWEIADALMGGTAAMRKAGQTFLPKWPNEEGKSYAARLATATLFPAFRRTIGVMAGKPFSKQLVLQEDAPPRIVELCQNVDRRGASLHVFISRLLPECLSHGIAGVLVDFTRTGEARTLADERSMGARPYCVHIRHDQILGWKADATGLTQLRIAESEEVDDGEYGTKTIQRVRVLRPEMWELWEADDKGVYSLVESGRTTIGKIPYVPFYGEMLDFMVGRSPLLELAHLNVKHWQSQSDQDTILHVARVPILAVMGVEDPFELTVGSSAAVKLPTEGKIAFVEHGGAAIEAGRLSLEELEEQMIQTGAELLIPTPQGTRSATEANNEAEANKSELQRIVESFEDGIDQVLQFMADWLNLPEGGHCALFKDYAAMTQDTSAQLIVSMQQGGLLSKRTALKEQQRRGVLAADVDPDEELEAVEADGPALGTVGREDGQEDD